MRHQAFATASLLLLFHCATARAAEIDSWRCSNLLILRGDASAKVLDKCGEPSARELVSEPIYARNANGSTRQIGVVERELWTYESSGRIPVRVTIEDGKVMRMEYLDR